MEMELRTSGAMSRAHFALVQQVENAASPQAVDAVISKEIQSIHNKLRNPRSGSSDASECLVLLLYCQSVAPYPIESKTKFALSHAVRLAESGATLKDRRIAYQYCIHNLPPGHDLHLMLVNTLRKDLCSTAKPRIALALDYIAQSPGQDLIPAIRDRLEELLIHKSVDLRRRTLLALKALASIDPSLGVSLQNPLQQCLRSGKLPLVVAAVNILASVDMEANVTSIADAILQHINDREHALSWAIVTFLKVLSSVCATQLAESLTERVLNALISLLTRLRPQRTIDGAVFLEVFSVLARIPPQAVLERVLQTPSASPFVYLRPLLAASVSDPNVRCLAIRCLLALPPVLWTGVSAREESSEATRRAVTIEEREVGNIMSFMESDDSTLRTLTFRVLKAVDASILEAYRERLLASLSAVPRPSSSLSSSSIAHSSSRPSDFEKSVLRLMELLEILAPNGSIYAAELKRVLHALSSSIMSPPGSPRSGATANRRGLVLESVVERALAYVSSASSEDQQSFLQEFASETLPSVDHSPEMGTSAFLNDTSRPFDYGPSGLTLLAAVAGTYGTASEGSTETLVLKLNNYLIDAPIAVQEVLLLSMLKLSANCADGVPAEVTQNVRALQGLAGRHIRMRCQQVISLGRDVTTLRKIVNSALSPSLPDFLMALESHREIPKTSPTRSPSIRPTSPPPFATPPVSPRLNATRQLRYDAYDAPRPAAPRSAYRQRTGSIESSQVGVLASPHSGRRRLDAKYENDEPGAAVSRGESPSLGASVNLLASQHQRRPSGSRPANTRVKDIVEDLELIDLDSPFRAEGNLLGVSPIDPTTTASTEPEPGKEEFEKLWTAMNDPKCTARGWHSSTPPAVVELLQTSLPQFTVLIAPDTQDPFIEDSAVASKEICVLVRRDEMQKFVACVRLKPADDGSCMWVLRAADAETKRAIRDPLD
ncbi:ARM repeat-containing protein [Clavulina sp. PMI_390]|nr:ARM repeat-containing protein [Clavulina sp. PMI_390]